MKDIKPTIGNPVVKRLTWIWVLAAGLMTAIAPAANAHDTGYRVIPGRTVVHVAYQPRYPHWLRKHKAFKQWYLHSHHFHGHARLDQRHVDWHRLYDLYLIDRYHAFRSEGHRHHHDRDRYRVDNRYRDRDRDRGRRRHDGD